MIQIGADAQRIRSRSVSLKFAAGVLAVATVSSPARANGTIAWDFQMDGSYSAQRGVVAADGAVYVQDVLGTLYALSASGELLWTYETGGLAEGPVVLGPDGMIYVGGNPGGTGVQIHALNSEGKVQWVFSDPGETQGIIAGPAVGPDGNVYAVTDLGGLGVLSVSGATGQLRWSEVGDPPVNEFGQTGAEITFGSQTPGGGIDQFFVGFDMFGTGFGVGLLFGFTLNGSQRLTVPLGGDGNVGQFQPAAGAAHGAVYVSSLVSSVGNRLRAFNADSGSSSWMYPTTDSTPTNRLSQPTVGPDGTIYIMRNGGEIHAVNPDGTNRWTHTTSSLFGTPVADPTNGVVVAAGVFAIGDPGFVRGLAVSTGQPLWTVTLPDEGGGHLIPYSRPWFSPNGRRVYISTTLLGSSQGAFLFAIDLASALPGDFDGDGDVDAADSAILANCITGSSAPCYDMASNCCATDLNGDTHVNCDDALLFAEAWTEPSEPPVPAPCASSVIPTVSSWGLVAMTLIMLAFGTAVIRTRQVPPA